jgi:RNA polymerase sigma factor (sigma-70 family)
MADLAARVGSDEKRLSRTIVRINTIEATSPLATGEHFDESSLPTALVPSEPESPDHAYERLETRQRVRTAIQSLPWREQKVIGLYYYGEVTMKQIGAEIGVNESRVSQLHARAIRRLREALGEMGPAHMAEMRRALVDFVSKKPKMVKAQLPTRQEETLAPTAGVVLEYKPPARKVVQAKATLRVARPRQAMAVAR